MFGSVRLEVGDEGVGEESSPSRDSLLSLPFPSLTIDPGVDDVGRVVLVR